jgi:hypothetical protein
MRRLVGEKRSCPVVVTREDRPLHVNDFEVMYGWGVAPIPESVISASRRLLRNLAA